MVCVNVYVCYFCWFMLIVVVNFCCCGYLFDFVCVCVCVFICGIDYFGKILGLLMDCFDLRVEVLFVVFVDLDLFVIGDSLVMIVEWVVMVCDI